MNKSIFLHEYKMITRNKKNILFILAIMALIASYCLMILPDKETPDSFNTEETEKKIGELSAIQTGKKSRGETGFSPMSGSFIYAANEYDLNLQTKLLQSFRDENFLRFAHLRLKDFAFNGISPGEITLANSPFPRKDILHLHNQTILRYQGYMEIGIPITYELLQQKTALQTIQNFFLSTAVLGILLCAIYFSCDMLTRDRQNRTILQGLPISWYRFINLKSLAVFCYTLLVAAGLIILSVAILTILNGFGSFSIRVPVHIPAGSGVFGINEYETITLAKFLIMAFGLLPLLILLFIRINAILSLIFKNTWIVLMVSTVLLFIEKIYYSRSLRELLGIEISNFPQTYFEIGKIITGEKNFLINLQSITYEKSLLVLLISLLVVEFSLFIASRIFNKRRFFQNT